MSAKFITNVLRRASDLTADDWQRLDTHNDPFVSRAFMVAAEKCVMESGPLGWAPMHFALRNEDGQLVGLLPLYARHHWYGDFAADYSWDAAWRQTGRNYFPKLVTGVPFTPSPGPRLLVAKDAEPDLRVTLINAAIDATVQMGASNWQCLFLREEDRDAVEGAELLMRRGVQFHWLNRGYRDFADFLETFTAEKRKKAKRERRAVFDAGLQVKAIHGDEIDDTLWPVIHRHYRSTFARLGGYPAFTEEFFRTVGIALGRKMVVLCALEGAKPVASAICYRDEGTLYGRHWGTDIDCPGLHFELCYHAGIEYAINHRLDRFEPGAQGEHKIARGFEPVSTWSAFWVADEGLRSAVERYLIREDGAVREYQEEMTSHLPFRKTIKVE